jgi:GNAT superfamily N-acetyltransferase
VPDFEVREVDVDDEAQLRAWWQASHDGAVHGRPYDTYEPWELTRESAAKPDPDWERVRVAAYDAGRVVGAGVGHLPQLDNLSHAYLEVTVPPDERRRGIGSALLNAVESAARDRGRVVLISEALTPPGGTAPGEAFALARGYRLANREGLKILDVGRYAGSWGALDDRVAARLGDYRVTTWGDTTPEEHLEGVSAALSSFLGMVPTGDLEMEDLNYTPERLVRQETRRAELGTARLVAAALAPDGELVGYHDLFVDAVRTRQADVGITMVLPQHRGHALGLAMKLATHRDLLARFPECEIVRTGNADVNEHMNAVNEQLGYRLVESILEFQKKL